MIYYSVVKYSDSVVWCGVVRYGLVVKYNLVESSATVCYNALWYSIVDIVQYRIVSCIVHCTVQCIVLCVHSVFCVMYSTV